jgi:putative transposase
VTFPLITGPVKSREIWQNNLVNRRDFAMKKSKFTEEQIAYALRQAETGTKVSEVCRKMGVAEATFYNWKKKYGGLGVSELRRLKQLEEENRQLKKLVADLSLDKQMLQDVIAKKL